MENLNELKLYYKMEIGDLVVKPFYFGSFDLLVEKLKEIQTTNERVGCLGIPKPDRITFGGKVYTQWAELILTHFENLYLDCGSSTHHLEAFCLWADDKGIADDPDAVETFYESHLGSFKDTRQALASLILRDPTQLSEVVEAIDWHSIEQVYADHYDFIESDSGDVIYLYNKL